MIEFSCADFTFPVLSHDKVLSLIALMDFKWVDIGLFKDRSHLQPGDQLDYPEKRGTALRLSAQNKGLGISGVFLQSSLDFKEFAINHPVPEIRKQEREVFIRALDYTLAAGCDHFTGLPGVDFGTNDSLDICLEELAWRVDVARQRKVIYAVEPHFGSIMENPENAIKILEKVQGLTIALDYSHYMFQGIYPDSIKQMVKYASLVHARGAAPGEMQTSFKRNKIDFKTVVDHLNEVSYSGKICMEYCWIEWENCNRTDNVSETLLLRNHLENLIFKNIK
jgi:hydroxypyruvate isomerase